MAVSTKDSEPLQVQNQPGALRYPLLAGNNVAIAIVEIDTKKFLSHPIVRHDFEEIVYILEGEVEMEYPEEKKKWIMKPGYAKYHPIGTAHRAKFKGDKIRILEVTAPPGHGIKWADFRR